MELFALPCSFNTAFQGKERKWWRRLLQVGGRAPNASVQILMGLSTSTSEWRVRRVALLLKLANAPVGSWRHLAFMAHHHLRSPWFAAATADLQIVLPDFRLIPTFVGSQPYLSCSGSWSEEGEWSSLLAYGLPKNVSGLRFCPSGHPLHNSLRRSIRFHVRRITDQLKLFLARESSSALYQEVASSALSSGTSKLALMAQRLQHPGPPLHIFLDNFPLLSHRAAIASFLCGDWFFAKFAKNYYARNLLPKSDTHRSLLQGAGVEERSVCLFCWHFNRVVALEDEFHVACVCPAYSQPRQDMLNNLHGAHRLSSCADLCHLLSLLSGASLHVPARYAGGTN
jgi:hypothetical protein